MKYFFMLAFAITSLAASSLVSAKEFTRIKSIKYRCGNPKSESQVKELMETVIDESLDAFEKINPQIKEKIEHRLAHRRLVVTCDAGALLMGGTAEHAGGPFLLPYKVIIDPYKLTELTNAELKNIFLHELLHFALIDNLSSKDHYNVPTDGTATQDNVCSCAFAVYPSSTFTPGINYEQALATCRNAQIK